MLCAPSAQRCIKHTANTSCLQTPPVKCTLSSCVAGVILTILQMRKLRPGEVNRLVLNQFGILAMVYWRNWGLLFMLVTMSLPFPLYSWTVGGFRI